MLLRLKFMFLAVKKNVKRKEFVMPKKGENIYKRKDGRWEGRIQRKDILTGKSKYQSIYGKTYKEYIFLPYAVWKCGTTVVTVKEKGVETRNICFLLSSDNEIHYSLLAECFD